MSQSGQQSQQPNGTATGAPPAHTSKGIVKQVNVVYVSDVIIDTTTTTFLVDGLATLCRFNALTSHSLLPLPLQCPSLLHLSLSRHHLFLLALISLSRYHSDLLSPVVVFSSLYTSFNIYLFHVSLVNTLRHQ